MTTKVVTWISDIGDPTDRGVRYVNVAFSDGVTGFIGKKEYDAALEVQGLLTEAKNQERDFTLEDTGKKNKNDGTRWKIKSFGEYQPTPYVQGGGSAQPSASGSTGSGVGMPFDSASRPHRSARSPEHDDFIQERMDRRTALMQAVALVCSDREDESIISMPDVSLAVAGHFYEWLRQSASKGIATSTTSDEQPRAINHDADRGQGEGSETARVGEGVGHSNSPCPPHDLDLSVAPKAMRYPCRKCNAWVKPVDAK